MRLFKGLVGGLALTGMLALLPAAAMAHGGGGGHGGGGHFGGFAGHSFAGQSFAGPRFAQHQGAHFARNGNRFGRDGDFFFGDPFWYDYPYYGFDAPDDGYDDGRAGDYSAGRSSPAEGTLSQPTIVAVQQALYHLGYYHGPIDGLIGPQTAKAVRWFQSVDKLSANGKLDGPTLKALRVS
jgi:hypothetical protein